MVTDDPIIEINKMHTQSGCEQFTNGCFSGPHKTKQKNIRPIISKIHEQ
jgi:hypothetical protein